MTRFLHCADIHLGYTQYNKTERFNDFGRALFAVVDKAAGRAVPFDPQVQGKVDFVILAGDLFHKRAIDALTLNQAIRGLQRLREAGIPCLAVEGNHERAYYDQTIGWMKFLALQDLLILLDAEFAEGKAHLKPWDAQKRQGSYIDLPGGVRVHGMRYYGSGTVAAVAAYADALEELRGQPGPQPDYSIFMAHAGVEGQLDNQAGGISVRQWSPLRPHIDYLALGHFHKPFQLEDWIYNPGSTENNSIAEIDWPKRGYLVVDVQSGAPKREGPPHTVVQGSNPRRKTRRYAFKTDRVAAPDDLLARLGQYLERMAAELADEHATELKRQQQEGTVCDLMPPVIELYLTGVLPFERSALDIDAIEALLADCFDPAPLVAIVKNLTRPAEFAVDADASLPRAELERRVLADLLARDSRYAGQREAWAALTVNLKQLALAGVSASAVIDELAAQMELIDHADSAS